MQMNREREYDMHMNDPQAQEASSGFRETGVNETMVSLSTDSEIERLGVVNYKIFKTNRGSPFKSSSVVVFYKFFVQNKAKETWLTEISYDELKRIHCELKDAKREDLPEFPCSIWFG